MGVCGAPGVGIIKIGFLSTRPVIPTVSAWPLGVQIQTAFSSVLRHAMCVSSNIKITKRRILVLAELRRCP